LGLLIGVGGYGGLFWVMFWFSFMWCPGFVELVFLGFGYVFLEGFIFWGVGLFVFGRGFG
jgi:hypothetical protein